MATEKKTPPIKLVWFERATGWLAGYDEEDNPTGSRPDLAVRRSAMNQTVAMVLRATKSQTSEALVSARWVERMTGVHQGTVAKALKDLESYGWLRWTQRRQNRVKVYRITIPQVLTYSQHRSSSADTSADRSAGTFSDTPGTPGTPLENLNEEEVCLNCRRGNGDHDVDCSHRPFVDHVPDRNVQNETEPWMAEPLQNLRDAGFAFDEVQYLSARDRVHVTFNGESACGMNLADAVLVDKPDQTLCTSCEEAMS